MIYICSFVSLTSISGGGGQTSLQLLSQPLISPDGVLQTLAQSTDLMQMLLNKVHTWQHKQTWPQILKFMSGLETVNSSFLLCMNEACHVTEEQKGTDLPEWLFPDW